MKILHTVEYYDPSVGGAQEVVKQLSEHMVTLGHDVTVATTKLPNRRKKVINGVKIKEFDISGNEVRGYAGKDIAKYKQFLIKGEFDVIMNYAAQQWATDLTFNVLDKIKAVKILAPCGFSALGHSAFRNYFDNLEKILPKYDGVVFTSNTYKDYEFAANIIKRKCYIIPNGASEVEFSKIKPSDNIKHKLGINVSDSIILNVSSHVLSKGHSETIKIFSRAKLKNGNLVIVGNTIPSEEDCTSRCQNTVSKFNGSILRLFDHKKIYLLSVSRNKTVDLFKSSDIFLFTSRVECSPLVLCEAFAAGLPVITYRVGNSEEMVTDSQAGLLIHNIADGAVALETILNNDEQRSKFAKKGRSYWEKKLRWDTISSRYEKLYISLKQTNN